MKSTATRKCIALVLLAALVTGCATASVPQRRAEWNAPATVTDQKFLDDEGYCNDRADKKSKGLRISGAVFAGIGIFLWPAAIPAIALSVAGATTKAGTKSACMADRGYDKDGSAPATPPQTSPLTETPLAETSR